MKLQIGVFDTIEAIDQVQWDRCARHQALVSHAFFRALERSAAVGPSTLIQPRYVVLRDAQGDVLACAPAMLKTGLLVEYGPEFRWLKAAQQEGIFSWPKFQVALPLYAVRGPKLLLHPNADNLGPVLLSCLQKLAVEHYQRWGLNLMHVEGALADELQDAGWLISHETHSFWRNRGWRCFDEYLADLPHRKRYQIQREKKAVAELGLTLQLYTGGEIGKQLLDAYHLGHVEVCRRYGNRPWLSKTTLHGLIIEMPSAIRLLAAFDGDRYVAGSLWIISGDTLVSRTWSSFEQLPALCFELICYRPIAFALDSGLQCVDSGLSAPHKQMRGYIDEPVCNAHWFADRRLRQLAEEALCVPSKLPDDNAP